MNQSSILQLRWENPTSDGVTSSTKACEYYKQLPQYLIESVIQKYQKDFELFEYESDSYLNNCGIS